MYPKVSTNDVRSSPRCSETMGSVDARYWFDPWRGCRSSGFGIDRPRSDEGRSDSSIREGQGFESPQLHHILTRSDQRKRRPAAVAGAIRLRSRRSVFPCVPPSVRAVLACLFGSGLEMVKMQVRRRDGGQQIAHAPAGTGAHW